MSLSPGGGSPSPRRSQKESLLRYIDTLIAALVEKAAEQSDPLVAISNILVGDYMHATRSVASDELRTLLFDSYNAYDIDNRRALKGVAVEQFLTDFIQSFAAYLGSLEIPAVQHESWEDRSRWDATKLDLLLRANRLKVGFEQDPDRWLSNWISFLDTTGDGKGIRYAEIQAAFAGSRTPEWLAEINKCNSLTEGPISTPIPQLNKSLVDVRSTRREQPVDPKASKWLTSGKTSYTPRSKSSPRHTTRYSSEMTLDIADAASSLVLQEKQRFGCCLFIYFFLYFIVVSVMFGLYVDVERSSSLQSSVKASLVQKEFISNRRLTDVTTIDDLNLYIRNVWLPAMHYFNSVGMVATTPQIRQRIKQQVTNCVEEVRIVAYGRGDNRSCFDKSTYRSTQFSGTTGTYIPTDYRGTYKTPVVNPVVAENRDFLIRLTVFPANISPVPVNSQSIALTGTVAVAQQGYTTLSSDGWIGYQMAFVELTAALYSNDEDVFTNSRIVFVMTDSGGIISYAGISDGFGQDHKGSIIETKRVNRHDSDHESDNARLSFEITFAVFTAAEIVYEIYCYVQSYRHTKSVIVARLTSSPSGLFALFFNSIVITVISLYLLLQYPSTTSTQTLDNGSDIADIYQYTALLCLGAILVVLSAVRILSSVGVLSKTLGTVIEVVSATLPSLLMFCFLFIVCVVVFAFIGHYCFGHGASEYSTVGDAIGQVLPAIIQSLDYSIINNPVADPSQGVIAPLYYWFAVIVIGVLLLTTMVSIFVAVYDATLYSFNLRRKLELDVPQTGRFWSRRAIQFTYSSYPSTLLKFWKKSGWITPVTRHKVQASCSVEIVEDSSLRIMISTSDSGGRSELFNSRGIIFLLPPELLANNPRNTNRTQMVKRCSLFTRCQAGLEPKNYNIRDWVQYSPEWWMRDEYLQDFAIGGDHWKKVESGVELMSSPEEQHRRAAWLSSKNSGSEAEACSAEHFTSTTYVPYATGTYRSRILKITQPLRELLHNGPKWEHESIVFEFPDVVSSQWPNTHIETRGTRSLPVKGVFKTYSTSGSMLVVVIGDQPSPSYIATGNERFTAAQIMDIKGKDIKRYIDQMIVGRFGISSNRSSHS